MTLTVIAVCKVCGDNIYRYPNGEEDKYIKMSGEGIYCEDCFKKIKENSLID